MHGRKRASQGAKPKYETNEEAKTIKLIQKRDCSASSCETTNMTDIYRGALVHFSPDNVWGVLKIRSTTHKGELVWFGKGDCNFSLSNLKDVKKDKVLLSFEIEPGPKGKTYRWVAKNIKRVSDEELDERPFLQSGTSLGSFIKGAKSLTYVEIHIAILCHTARLVRKHNYQLEVARLVGSSAGIGAWNKNELLSVLERYDELFNVRDDTITLKNSPMKGRINRVIWQGRGKFYGFIWADNKSEGSNSYFDNNTLQTSDISTARDMSDKSKEVNWLKEGKTVRYLAVKVSSLPLEYASFSAPMRALLVWPSDFTYIQNQSNEDSQGKKGGKSETQLKCSSLNDLSSLKNKEGKQEVAHTNTQDLSKVNAPYPTTVPILQGPNNGQSKVIFHHADLVDLDENDLYNPHHATRKLDDIALVLLIDVIEICMLQGSLKMSAFRNMLREKIHGRDDYFRTEVKDKVLKFLNQIFEIDDEREIFNLKGQKLDKSILWILGGKIVKSGYSKAIIETKSQNLPLIFCNNKLLDENYCEKTLGNTVQLLAFCKTSSKPEDWKTVFAWPKSISKKSMENLIFSREVISKASRDDNVTITGIKGKVVGHHLCEEVLKLDAQNKDNQQAVFDIHVNDFDQVTSISQISDNSSYKWSETKKPFVKESEKTFWNIDLSPDKGNTFQCHDIIKSNTEQIYTTKFSGTIDKIAQLQMQLQQEIDHLKCATQHADVNKDIEEWVEKSDFTYQSESASSCGDREKRIDKTDASCQTDLSSFTLLKSKECQTEMYHTYSSACQTFSTGSIITSRYFKK